jgi:hypothetical protein
VKHQGREGQRGCSCFPRNFIESLYMERLPSYGPTRCAINELITDSDVVRYARVELWLASEFCKLGQSRHRCTATPRRGLKTPLRGWYPFSLLDPTINAPGMRGCDRYARHAYAELCASEKSLPASTQLLKAIVIQRNIKQQ